MSVVADKDLKANLGRHSRRQIVFVKQVVDFVLLGGQHHRLPGFECLQRNEISQSTKIANRESNVLFFEFRAQRAISEPVCLVADVRWVRLFRW